MCHNRLTAAFNQQPKSRAWIGGRVVWNARRLPALPKSSFLVALILTTSRLISTSCSTNQVTEKGDLVPGAGSGAECGPFGMRGAPNLEHISQSRPDSGLGLSHSQYESLETHLSCSLFARQAWGRSAVRSGCLTSFYPTQIVFFIFLDSYHKSSDSKELQYKPMN